MENKIRKYRVQLDFSQEAFDELESLKEKLGATSRADVVRNALGILKWIYKKRVVEKCRIVAIGKDSKGKLVEFEPEFPFLPSGDN